MFELSEQAWRAVTELYVPLGGVIASTAVAVVAWRTSRRAVTIAEAADSREARKDEHDRESNALAARRDASLRLAAFIDENLDNITAPRGTLTDGRKLALEINPVPGAPQVFAWVTEALFAIMEVPNLPPAYDGYGEDISPNVRVDIWRELSTVMTIRAARWTLTGEFDSTPFTDARMHP